MKTAREFATEYSVKLGVSEERVLRFLGEYVRVGDFYLKHPDEEIPNDFQNNNSLSNFIEYVSLILKDEQKSAIVGKEQRLKDTGWVIHASTNDSIFVVSNISGDWQVLRFYKNNSIPMVEGYFANLLPLKARRELFNDPDRFVKKFNFYCSALDPDWSTMELNVYSESLKNKKQTV